MTLPRSPTRAHPEKNNAPSPPDGGRRGSKIASRGVLGEPLGGVLGNPWSGKGRLMAMTSGTLRWFRPVAFVAGLILVVVLPAPLSGQFGEERAFGWFTGCAPIRISGQHFAQVLGEWTALDLPADVKHVIRTRLDEHDLATEDVFAWGLSGDPNETAILPRMEVTVLTQASGRRDISISFQKWLRDPISDKEHYATTWHVDVEDRPTRERELANVETFVGVFLDNYLEVNAEACNAKPQW
ncbi:MAG: hypothetical protein OXT71_12495 [Acidobacteriota bacterium]|nr:hypothetical protein [Acidobacteriota bacterium]